MHKNLSNPRAHPFVGFGHKPFPFAVLLAESFHHTGGAQHLMHDPEGGTFEFFYLARLAAQTTAIRANNKENRVRNGQGDERNPPVDPHDDANRRGECERGSEKRHHTIDRDVLKGGGVVLNAIH